MNKENISHFGSYCFNCKVATKTNFTKTNKSICAKCGMAKNITKIKKNYSHIKWFLIGLGLIIVVFIGIATIISFIINMIFKG